ncbi:MULTISPECIES: ALF repeat-containing protein [unclassified Streptomyces]|uniref:ALF repeat-containing protein n=1 Tax=unclassified Streptomyces TaxID=2593676 RepID=UPI00163C1358|nr:MULTISPECIES: ALF repeat-containing protein [unclassified Streptomyces]
MKKQARFTALLAAAAVAPAVLFSSPAVAAEAPSKARSAPDQGAETTPDEAAKQKARSELEDRIKVSQIAADKNSGRQVRREAHKALDGTAEDVRRFLETGLDKARDTDNRVAVIRTLSGKYVGRNVREAVDKAMDGTPQDRVYYLEEGYRLAQIGDNRTFAVQISSIGGPAVQEAADKAIWEGDDAIQRFLDVGQYEARAKDEAARKKAEEEKAAKEKAAKDKASKDKAAEEKAAEDKAAKDKAAKDGGKGGAGTDGKTVTPATDARSGGEPSSVAVSGNAVTPTSGGTSLAATGVSPATPWALGGAAVAVTAGAGLVIAGRRRTAATERG